MSTEFEGCDKCKSFSRINKSQSGYCLRKNVSVCISKVKFCEDFKPVKAGSFLNEYHLKDERRSMDGYRYWVL